MTDDSRKTEKTTAPPHVEVVADRTDDGTYEIEVRGASPERSTDPGATEQGAGSAAATSSAEHVGSDGDATGARSLHLSASHEGVARAPTKRGSRAGLYVASAAGVAAIVGVGLTLGGGTGGVEPEVVEPEETESFRGFVSGRPEKTTVPPGAIDVGASIPVLDAGVGDAEPEPEPVPVAAERELPQPPVERVQTVIRQRQVERMRRVPVERDLAELPESARAEAAADEEAYYDEYYDEGYEEQYYDDEGYDDERDEYDEYDDE